MLLVFSQILVQKLMNDFQFFYLYCWQFCSLCCFIEIFRRILKQSGHWNSNNIFSKKWVLELYIRNLIQIQNRYQIRQILIPFANYQIKSSINEQIKQYDHFQSQQSPKSAAILIQNFYFLIIILFARIHQIFTQKVQGLCQNLTEIQEKVQQKNQKTMSLIVKPLNAELIKGNDLIFFKKSPYVVCQVGNEIMKTNPDKNGGKTPKWSQTFTFRDLGHKLRITLMGKHTIGKQEVIGQGEFDLSPAYNNPYVSDNRYVQILKNGIVMAKVMCHMQYQGTASNNFASRNQQYQNMSNIRQNQYQNAKQTNTVMNNSNISTNNGSFVQQRSSSNLKGSNIGSDIRYSNNRSPSPTPIDYRMNTSTYTAPQITSIPPPVFIIKEVPVTVPPTVNGATQLSGSRVGIQSYPMTTYRVPLSTISGTSVINSPRTVYRTPQKILYQVRQSSPIRTPIRQNSLTKSPSFGPDN